MPQELLKKLTDNDPVIGEKALAQLVSRGIRGADLADFIKQNVGSIFTSPTARYYLAKLSGRLAPSVVPNLVDCVQSGSFEAKLVAAQCLHFVTDPHANPMAEGAMLRLVDSADRDLVRAGMEALGHLGAIRSGPRIWDAAKRVEGTTSFALVGLLRLIAADDMDDIVGLRFGYFNELFVTLSAHEKASALSIIHFVLPELKNRMRDRAIDLIVQVWINSPDRSLRLLGADALAILRAKRVRARLAALIIELLDRKNDDTSIFQLASAWGRIGTTDENSLKTLKGWYESGDDRLTQCTNLALSFSFPALMADPKTRSNRFLRQFAIDALNRPESELQAHVLLGLSVTKQKPDLLINRLASTNPTIRAGAAIGLAINGSKKCADALEEYISDFRTASFERLMALSAMTRLNPACADELHQVLCSMLPIDVWRIRHGTSPRLSSPDPWMDEIVRALRRAKTGGTRRGEAWAEVLAFDSKPDAIEPMPPKARPKSKLSPKNVAEPPEAMISQALGLRPDQLLVAMRPEGWSGLFVLGCFDRRVTFFTQQVRALNLVKALFDHEDLSCGSRVGVIGGGAAGVTAAMAAAKKGCNVTLYETGADVLHIQAHSDRILHPHLYEWPEEGSLVPRAELPFLNWTADEARKVVELLRAELKAYRPDPPGHLDIRTNKTITAIKQLSKEWRRIKLRLICDDNPKELEEFHVAIIAIGFGLEQSSLPGIDLPSYWEGDGIQGPERPGRKIFISGSGDGGLLDLARATLDFRQRTYFDEINENPAFIELAEQILRVDGEARRRRESGAAVDLFRLYDQLVPDPKTPVQLVKVRKRSDTTVVFNHPKGVFGLDSALTSRMLAYLIIKAGLVRLESRRIGVDGRSPLPRKVLQELEAEGVKLKKKYDVVLLRHGPDRGHFARQFPALVTACKELGGKLAHLDLTRTLEQSTLKWFGGLQVSPIEGRSRLAREKSKRPSKQERRDFVPNAFLRVFQFFENKLADLGREGRFERLDQRHFHATVVRNSATKSCCVWLGYDNFLRLEREEIVCFLEGACGPNDRQDYLVFSSDIEYAKAEVRKNQLFLTVSGSGKERLLSVKDQMSPDDLASHFWSLFMIGGKARPRTSPGIRITSPGGSPKER